MKKAILLLCLLVPMMANAGFLSGAFALLKFSGSTIECACDARLATVVNSLYESTSEYYTTELTFSNDKNKITVSLTCKENPAINKYITLSRNNCKISSKEDASDSEKIYFIQSDNTSFGYLYNSESDKCAIFIGTDRNKQHFIEIYPRSIEAYNSEGKPLYDDGSKADCGTIRAWFRYVTSYWKNN